MANLDHFQSLFEEFRPRNTVNSPRRVKKNRDNDLIELSFEVENDDDLSGMRTRFTPMVRACT